VTVHQFVPIFRTEIIAVVQCMYADYGGGLVDDF